MRHLFSRFVWVGSLITLACATAIDPELDRGDDELEGETGGSLSHGATSGVTGGTGPSTSGGVAATAGKGGSVSSGFGGTVSTGGSSKGGSSSSGGTNTGGVGGKGGGASLGGAGSGTSGSGGSSSSGTSAGGKAGMSNGGTTSGGSTAGTASGGAPPSTLCDGVADWVNDKDYVIGDTVASTCTGAFRGDCPEAQKHKFLCSPPGQNPELAVPWCKQRQPGSGNGWAAAWVDQGQCQ